MRILGGGDAMGKKRLREAKRNDCGEFCRGDECLRWEIKHAGKFSAVKTAFQIKWSGKWDVEIWRSLHESSFLLLFFLFLFIFLAYPPTFVFSFSCCSCCRGLSTLGSTFIVTCYDFSLEISPCCRRDIFF